MDSTPPYEDETDETPRHIKHPIQRHKGEARYRPARSYYYSRPYYSDEHPEVPKVKRASLHVDAEECPPVSTEKVRRITKKAPSSEPTTQLKCTERDQRGPSSISRTARAEKTSYRPATHPSYRSNRIKEPPLRSSSPENISRARPYEEDFFADFEENTEHTEAAPHTKIMVAQRRRSSISTVYEPPFNVSHRSRGLRKKQRNTLFTQIQLFSHNRMSMITVSIIIVMLIILPIIVGVLVNNTRQITTVFNPGVNSTAISNSPAGVQSGGIANGAHGLTITPSDTDHPAPPVFASSAYLLDANTGATLYAYNPFEHLPMMSTTKLMTAILAVEKGNPDQNITINDAISNDLNTQLSADSSVMGIKKGETYTLRDLLYGLLLPSGNDAAIAIADGISGSVPQFVALMNQKARELGLHDTHYTNPHGLLDANHYSSAHDLALLGRFSMNIPLIHQISSTKTYTITKSADHAAHDTFNGNQFLWWYPGVDGGKPGWDGNGNFVQVVSVTRNGHHMIGVTMHTKDWWTDMRDLMNWGFNNFQWISPRDVDAVSAIPYDTDWNYFVKDQKDNTIPTADHGRYYIYTGYSVSGIILTYFDKNGGLQKLGYPTSLPKPTGNTTVKQQFEHGSIQCDTTSKQCGRV